MDKDGKFTIDGKDYFTLVTFEYMKKNIILYTDYSLNVDNNYNIYSSMYETTIFGISPITEKNILEYTNNYITTLKQDLLNNIILK